MSLKMRIWMLPAIATAIFLFSGLVIGSFTTRAAQAVGALGQTEYPNLDRANRLARQIEIVQDLIATIVAQGEKERLPEAEEAARSLREALQKLLAEEQPSPHAKAVADAFDAYVAAAMPNARMLLGLQSGNPVEVMQRMEQALKDLRQSVEAMQAEAAARFDAGLQGAQRGISRALSVTVAAALLVVAAVGGASHVLVRSVMSEIGGEPRYARQVLCAMSDGDLAQKVALREGDADSLLAAIRAMQAGIAHLIEDIRAGTHALSDASMDIAAGNQDLSKRTEDQAASLQKTAASMEQISSTVRQAAENAREANRIATQASEAADKGGTVVGEVVQTMESILSSSRKIADIVNVIDGIAFQTNILALNAAVEAARAGEDGRGFAVVAGEVRNLAQRSAQAAREIKTMIADSVAKVDAGGKLVHEAGATISEAVEQVRRVNDLIAEISTAATEQSQGIVLVTEAVTQMDRVTQQNAAMVEESAAAAASMKAETSKLATAVSVFKT